MAHIHVYTRTYDHPRACWRLASIPERKREKEGRGGKATQLKPSVYIWKCAYAPAFLPVFILFPAAPSSRASVTSGIADGRNRNVKFLDPSRRMRRHALRALCLAEKSVRPSGSGGYVVPLSDAGDPEIRVGSGRVTSWGIERRRDR